MEEGVHKCIKRIGIYFSRFDYRVGMALNGDHVEWLVPFLLSGFSEPRFDEEPTVQ